MSKLEEFELLRQIEEKREQAKKQKQQEKEEEQKRKQQEKERLRQEKQQKEEEERKQKQQEKERLRQEKQDELNNILALKEIAKQEKEIQKEKEMQKINDSMDAQYLEMKKEVEKEWFILNDLGKYAKFVKDQNKFIIHNEQSTKLNLSVYNLDVMTKNGKQKMQFYDKWIKDPNRRQYDSIVFDPQQKNKRDFNTFTGFMYDNVENPKKSTKIIHQLLDHLFKPEYKKYILEWLSFIIKKRDKTNVCIVLYSNTHGVGKNSFIELIRKVIDEKYVSKIENIDEIAAQFNSFVESKLVLYGDEILAKTKDLYTSLKNTITRSQVKINKKGIDPYHMTNYANWIFTTNQRCPFMIEKDDRRITMLDVNEKKLQNELCEAFYEAINDEDIMKTFYNELLEIEIPDKIECLSTKLKREIQNIYIPSPIKYLYKNYKRLEGTKWGIIELYDKIKEFEKQQGFTELKTTNQMAMILKDISDFTYKSNDKRGYRFKDLESILKIYDSEMFNDYTIIDEDFEEIENNNN